MAESPYLGLPFLEAGQAQKHVTHNEALRILDALVHLSVRAVSASAPLSPEEGERHIVEPGASGLFAAKDNKVAIYEDGAWRFLTPRNGWRAWNEDEGALLLWDGTEWVALETGSGSGFDPDDVDHIYLNDAAPGDANVKLAMRGQAALLHAIPAAESGNGDVRLQISKESASDTASVFFSTNFSGRAEFGLAGSDNFKLKVSSDGSGWTEALDIDKSTGRVRLPVALSLSDADQVVTKRHVRELLTANQTYYVRSDGSDSNNGLANTSGGAFLTIQKAIDSACALDLSIYSVTINVANGTYTTPVVLKSYVGAGPISLVGNTGSPSSVIISTTSAAGIAANGVIGKYNIGGFKIQTTTSGSCLLVTDGSVICLNDPMEFGGSAFAHMAVTAGATVTVIAAYKISGGATYHMFVLSTGKVIVDTVITTVNGSLTMTAFAYASALGVVNTAAWSFTGAGAGTGMTGKKYEVTLNALVNSAGVTLPGATAGTTGTGGQYG